jgi:hypothetical protein
MIDYFLKFTSKHEMEKKFLKHNMMQSTVEIEIDFIGDLIIKEPVVDQNFHIIEESIVDTNYHVNLRCRNPLPPEILNDLPIINPKTPKRLFA